MTFALVGNQNCGKTTLFNALTGSDQHVGNFPGVTVEQKTGLINGQRDVLLVDLPGIYSIRPYTAEERVTRDFVLSEKPDGIINILDATNIERNLYLTLQLLELQIPTVIALNMMDEVRGNGGSIDVQKLSVFLGVPVLPIAAVKNEGTAEVAEKMLYTAKNRVLPTVTDFCPAGPVHRCLHTVTRTVDRARALGISTRFCASKLIEGDAAFAELLKLDRNETELIERAVTQMERETGMDRNAALAAMRYDFIEDVCRGCVVKCRESREHRRSVKIDRLLTGKYTALPAFLLIIAGIFYLTFRVIGSFLSDILTGGIDTLTGLVDSALAAHGTGSVVRSLIIDGIFSGVGSVLGFLPVIVVLFFFLSVLEDTGYMARIAFVMDRPLRRIGLSGKSFVPLLTGFGCSVPAVMAARTLSSERDRRMTVLLIPFMSCSAKIPIYAVFASAFFSGHEALVMTAMYLSGIACGILSAILTNKTVFRGKPVPFVMELPNYRLPSAKSVGLLMWGRAKDFVQKAFTVIFAASIIIWFLQSFDARLNTVSDSADSLLAMIGRFLSPVFRPLGFGDWRAVTALLSGFSAKEAVVSTLSVLLNVSTAELNGALSSLFTPVSAGSFLLFSLLYTPCAAAVAAIRKELGSPLKALGTVVCQCVTAWLVSFCFYTVCSVFVR